MFALSAADGTKRHRVSGFGEFGAETIGVAGGVVYAALDDQKGTMVAVDVASGKTLWRDAYGEAQGSPSMISADGVVFTGLPWNPQLSRAARGCAVRAERRHRQPAVVGAGERRRERGAGRGGRRDLHGERGRRARRLAGQHRPQALEPLGHGPGNQPRGGGPARACTGRQAATSTRSARRFTDAAAHPDRPARSGRIPAVRPARPGRDGPGLSRLFPGRPGGRRKDLPPGPRRRPRVRAPVRPRGHRRPGGQRPLHRAGGGGRAV